MPKAPAITLPEILQHREFEELQERYRTLMDLLPDAIAMHQGGLIVYLNKSGMELLRCESLEEIVGRPVMSVVHAESTMVVRERVADLLDGSGRVPLIEEKFVRLDGSPVDVEVAACRIQYNGAPAVLVAMRDITERKIAERLLQRSEERFRRLAEYARDVVYRIRLYPESGFEYLSPSVFAITGYTPDEFYTSNLLGKLIIHPEDRSILLESTASDESVRKPLTIRWIRKDGAVIWVEYHNVPVRDTKGNLVAIEGIVRDITERKEAEENVRAALGEKELLLKEIHHRVKNNMQVIASLLNLEAQHVVDERDRRLFQESQNRVRSMSLVHERLYNSHSLSRISLSSYLGVLCDQLMAVYRRVGIAISIDVHDIDLGIDQAIPCGLIINELVTNALKYAFVGREGGTIRIEACTEPGYRIHMCVIDDGVGLPEYVNPSDSPTLGLQLIILLAQQLGAEVTFERNNGTACHFSFPCRNS